MMMMRVFRSPGVGNSDPHCGNSDPHCGHNDPRCGHNDTHCGHRVLGGFAQCWTVQHSAGRCSAAQCWTVQHCGIMSPIAIIMVPTPHRPVCGHTDSYCGHNAHRYGNNGTHCSHDDPALRPQ